MFRGSWRGTGRGRARPRVKAGALEPSELQWELSSLPPSLSKGPAAGMAQPTCLSMSGMMWAVQWMRIRVRTGMKKVIPEVRPRRTVDCLSTMQVLYLALVYLADEQAQQRHKEDGDAKECRPPCTASDSCSVHRGHQWPLPYQLGRQWFCC